MTKPPDLSPDEWKTLSGLPMTISLAVMSSGSSGPVQLFQELAVLAGTLRQSQDLPTDNRLVEAVIAVYRDDSATRAGNEGSGAGATSLPSGDASTEEGRQALRRTALDEAAQARTILEAKSTAEEAEGYKRWVLAVGRKVANAAKEGSVLGIGGVQFSAEERETLDAIAAALGAAP